MATNAGELSDILLRRVRGEGGIAFTDDYVRNVLTLCQRTVNAFTRRIVATTTLTTLQYKLIYSMKDDLEDALVIINCEVDDRTLHRVPWQELGQYSTSWFRATGSRFEVCAQIGYDLFVLYPALTSDSSITVRYAKKTNKLATDTTALELPDEDLDLMLDIAEIILLLGGRNVRTAQEKIKDVTASVLSAKQIRHT